jgi:C-terminal processing protease CtpA/Prc
MSFAQPERSKYGCIAAIGVVIGLLVLVLKIASYFIPVASVVADVQKSANRARSQEESTKAQLKAIEKSFREKEEMTGRGILLWSGKLHSVPLYYPTVLEVSPGSAAADGGLRVGDKILSFDEVRMGCVSKKDTGHFKETCQGRRNKDVSLVVKRAGERVTLRARVPADGVLVLRYQMEKW